MFRIPQCNLSPIFKNIRNNFAIPAYKTRPKVLQQKKQFFQYFKVIFPKISDAKFKEGIFIGSHIRQLLDNEDFETTMDELEQAAWYSHKDLCKEFLGKD